MAVQKKKKLNGHLVPTTVWSVSCCVYHSDIQKVYIQSWNNQMQEDQKSLKYRVSHQQKAREDIDQKATFRSTFLMTDRQGCPTLLSQKLDYPSNPPKTFFLY